MWRPARNELAFVIEELLVPLSVRRMFDEGRMQRQVLEQRTCHMAAMEVVLRDKANIIGDGCSQESGQSLPSFGRILQHGDGLARKSAKEARDLAVNVAGDQFDVVAGQPLARLRRLLWIDF